jgi:diguanylate cyclase (GGDEF)-like protein
VYRPGDAPELVAEIEELRRHVAELEAENAELLVLQQVFSTINSTLNIDDILSTVLRGIHVALHFQRAILFDVDEETLARRIETDPHGDAVRPKASAEVPKGPELLKILAKESDFFVGEADDGQAPVPDPKGVYCLVPLVARGTVRGILYVDDATNGRLRDNSIRVLLDFAAQAAVALENARLYSEQRRLLEETQRLAATDPLTGLSNRRALEDLLEHEIHNSLRHADALTYAIFDLDDLKKINDSGGHAAGDQALRRFAQTLKAVSRKGDIVARYAGDEFVVVMTQTDRAAAAAGLERFEETLGREGIRCSGGAALLPADATDAAGLFLAADIALYHAKKLKHEGKNHFVFYDAVAEEAAVLAPAE